MASATSGMRATSAFTNTMAVIMGPRYRPRAGSGLVDGRQRASLVEGHQHRAGLLDRVVPGEGAGGAADGAGPLAVDMHEPDAWLLQPPEDLLGLLRARGRGRPGTG